MMAIRQFNGVISFNITAPLGEARVIITEPMILQFVSWIGYGEIGSMSIQRPEKTVERGELAGSRVLAG